MFRFSFCQPTLYLFKQDITQFGNWNNNVLLAFYSDQQKVGSSASFRFSVIGTREETSAIKFMPLCSVLLDLCTQFPDSPKFIRYNNTVLCRLSASTGIGNMWPGIMSVGEKSYFFKLWGSFWTDKVNFSKLCLVQLNFYFNLGYLST